MANEPLVFPDLNRIVLEIHTAAGSVAEQVTEIVRRHAPEYSGPDPTHVHVLRESLEPRTEDLEFGSRISVVATGEGGRVAEFLLRGTASHFIPKEAKTSGALRFWTQDGQIHFAKQVFVSGIAPDDFVSAAQDEISATLQREVYSTVSRF